MSVVEKTQNSTAGETGFSIHILGLSLQRYLKFWQIMSAGRLRTWHGARVSLVFLQLTLIQADAECIMLPFPVTMGVDRSQRVKGMN